MSDVQDQGGDPACWAHLFEEPTDQEAPDTAPDDEDGPALADDSGGGT